MCGVETKKAAFRAETRFSKIYRAMKCWIENHSTSETNSPEHVRFNIFDCGKSVKIDDILELYELDIYGQAFGVQKNEIGVLNNKQFVVYNWDLKRKFAHKITSSGHIMVYLSEMLFFDKESFSALIQIYLRISAKTIKQREEEFVDVLHTIRIYDVEKIRIIGNVTYCSMKDGSVVEYDPMLQRIHSKQENEENIHFGSAMAKFSSKRIEIRHSWNSRLREIVFISDISCVKRVDNFVFFLHKNQIKLFEFISV